MSSIESFSQQLEEIRKRTARLRSGDRPPEPGTPLLSDAMAELDVAFEELSVAEQELRSQEEQIATIDMAMAIERDRYLELFEFAPDGYLVTDVRGVITEANRAASTMLK